MQPGHTRPTGDCYTCITITRADASAHADYHPSVASLHGRPHPSVTDTHDCFYSSPAHAGRAVPHRPADSTCTLRRRA